MPQPSPCRPPIAPESSTGSSCHGPGMSADRNFPVRPPRHDRRGGCAHRKGRQDQALAQLVLNGGIQRVTADHVGMHRWMLMLLGCVEFTAVSTRSRVARCCRHQGWSSLLRPSRASTSVPARPVAPADAVQLAAVPISISVAQSWLIELRAWPLSGARRSRPSAVPLAKQGDRLILQGFMPAFEVARWTLRSLFEATNCCCSARAAIGSPWSVAGVSGGRGPVLPCSIAQPAQCCQLLAGANAGFVILGVERVLDLLRQLFSHT